MILQKLFGFDTKTMKVKTEIIAGITTFLAMAYILAVNPEIFTTLERFGMPTNSVFTATALSAIVGTLVMSLYAKKPFALAPGMGLNAFFVYTVCLGMGHSWQFALTAVFIEGILFVILTLTNVRTIIVDAIPFSLRNAISAGIGLFIALIGLKNGSVIVANDSTFITLGDIFHGPALLAVIGFAVTSVLLVLKVPGNILIGIIATALIGMIPVWQITDAATGEVMRGALTTFDGVVRTPPSIAPIFCKFQWHDVLSLDMLVVVFTFLFIDMFDTIGTLIGVSNRAGMVDDNGNVKNLNQAFMADAIGTTVGAMLGTSTVTTYVESASGVNVGGRSGVTSFTTAICFLIALLFAPLFLAIPAQATAAALILVGVMMMHDIRKVDFSNYVTAIPCFVCIVLMPLTYSISDGILMGVISYVLIHLLSGTIKDTDERNNMNWGTILLAALFICRYAFL